MVIAFDLDDVLCYRPDGVESKGVDKYHHCKPIEGMINIVNGAYNEGHTIKIYTARGMTTFGGDTNKVYSNLYQLTVNQLNIWGISYHELVMGKLHYDLLIDDKVINSLRIKSLSDIKENM